MDSYHIICWKEENGGEKKGGREGNKMGSERDAGHYMSQHGGIVHATTKPAL